MSGLSTVNLYAVPLPSDLKYGDMLIVSVNNRYSEHYVQYVNKTFKKVGVWCNGSISQGEIDFRSFDRIVIKVIKKR